MNTAQIIIPARLASTRLPRKLLLRETGKSLIQHTYEAARRSARAAGVCVATDHAEIFDEVRSFGGQVEMTDPAAPSGTDRVAEVARRMMDVDIIVNVQGDEPEIAGTSIDLAIELLEANPTAVMGTLATPIRSRRQLEDPACVKVVFDAAGRAMYFSRSVIPHPRQWDDALLASNPPTFVVFLSGSERMHFSTERYLVNQLRERFGFFAAPIKIHQRLKPPRKHAGAHQSR